MFPLKTRKTTGYAYGQKTFYSAHHLGQDYSAKTGDKLYAPFDGKINQELNGKQGGLTIWFQADGSTDIMRFMHLSKFVAKVGKVKEGDLIALTGNTGSATTGAHLHIDISKKKVVISDWMNFKDPEKYQWDKPKNAPVPTEKPKVVSVPQESIKTPPAPTQSVPESVSSANSKAKGAYIFDTTPVVWTLPKEKADEYMEKIEKPSPWQNLLKKLIDLYNKYRDLNIKR